MKCNFKFDYKDHALFHFQFTHEDKPEYFPAPILQQSVLKILFAAGLGLLMFYLNCAEVIIRSAN